MMLKVYLVERRLKHLIEVSTDFDTDFTVRQFLYQLLKLRLKFNEHYLHYGLYVHSEKEASKRKRSKNAIDEDDDEDESEVIVPILNLDKTIDELVNEYGLSVTFVIRRKVFSPRFLLKFESNASQMSETEVDFLFE